MTKSLVWGKDFEFKETLLASGQVYNEVFGVEGDSEGISSSSIQSMQALAAKHGVPESLWPIYPDCDVDADVPLDDARAKSRRLRAALERIPEDEISRDYWLSLISRLLRQGNLFFIAA
jgi:hypothetical protein